MAYTKVTGALVGSLSDLDLTNVGDIQLDSISGDGDTNTAITFSGSDVITLTTGGETQLTFNNGSILPTTNNDVDLGSDALEFKNAWFDGTVETDNLTIGGAQGSDGEVLTSTGSGVGWEAVSAGITHKSGGTSFTSSLIVGHSTTGTLSGDAVGNTALGINAMQAITSADGVTALGKDAGKAITSGGNNTIVGYQCAEALNTGTDNTAIGYYALGLCTNGVQNTAVGRGALDATGAGTDGSYNVAVGNDALGANTEGQFNVAVGRRALYTNSTADENTAVGYLALYENQTGANNTAVGNGALQLNTASSNTAVGDRAGTTWTGNGSNVAIGKDAAETSGTTCTNGVWIGAGCGTTEAIDGNKAGQVVIGSLAQIGNHENIVAIGKSCPGQGTNTVTFGKSASSKVNLNWDTATAWTYPSDERMKENIADMPTSAGLSFINTLKPRTFTWRKVEDYDESLTNLGGTMKISGDKFKKSEGTQYGFVAQEVKTAMEAASITPDPDGGGYGFWTQSEVGTQQGVSKEDLIPSLVKAIQELSAKVDALEG